MTMMICEVVNWQCCLKIAVVRQHITPKNTKKNLKIWLIVWPKIGMLSEWAKFVKPVANWPHENQC